MTLALAFLHRYWLHLLGVAVIAWSLHAAYGFAYNNGFNAANARAEKIIGEFAKAEADAQAKARKAEQDTARKIEAIADEYEQEKQAAADSASRLVDDLRDGNLKLHQRWQAAIATSDLSRTAASAAESHAAARDREESAARVVRAAADADAQIRGLQAVIRADRK